MAMRSRCHNSSLFLQVAMAHAPADEAPIPDGYSVSDEFFVYKFSKEQAGLSGLAFDEGIFGVFGYVTEASLVASACCAFTPNESCALGCCLFSGYPCQFLAPMQRLLGHRVSGLMKEGETQVQHPLAVHAVPLLHAHRLGKSCLLALCRAWSWCSSCRAMTSSSVQNFSLERSILSGLLHHHQQTALHKLPERSCNLHIAAIAEGIQFSADVTCHCGAIGPQLPGTPRKIASWVHLQRC